MKLILQILGDRPEDQQTKVEFGSLGGTLGRDEANEWFLDNEFVSREHARVWGDDNGFYIVDDHSANGTYLNDPNGVELERGSPYPLHSGDRLYIGDYEILVSIIATAEEPDPSPPEPLLPDDLDDEPVVDDQLPPDDWWRRGQTYAQDDTQKMPEVRLPPPPGPPAPVAAVPHATTPEPPAQDSAAMIKAFADAAGLDPLLFDSPEGRQLMHALGRVVRSSLEGLRALMDERKTFKEGFLRVDPTRIAATENNPLKHDFTVEEILRLALAPEQSKYLPLPDAVDEAFLDARTHLSAVTKGMQRAFDGLLAYLDPRDIEAKADVSGPARLIGGKKKAWDVYCEMYGRIADTDFYQAFGKEFVKGYTSTEDTAKRSFGEI